MICLSRDEGVSDECRVRRRDFDIAGAYEKQGLKKTETKQ